MAERSKLILGTLAIFILMITACGRPEQLVHTPIMHERIPWQVRTMLDASPVREVASRLAKETKRSVHLFVAEFSGDYIPDEHYVYGGPRANLLLGHVRYIGMTCSKDNRVDFATNICFDQRGNLWQFLLDDVLEQPQVWSDDLTEREFTRILNAAQVGEISSGSVSWDGHQFFLIFRNDGAKTEMGYGANLYNATPASRSMSNFIDSLYSHVQKSMEELNTRK